MSTATTIEKVWEQRETNQEGILEVLVGQVVEQFGRLFVPYSFMGTERECGNTVFKQEATYTLQHKDLFGCADAQLALESTLNAVLGRLLSIAESTVKCYFNLVFSDEIPTVEQIEAQVAKMDPAATHLWVGRDVVKALNAEPGMEKMGLKDMLRSLLSEEGVPEFKQGCAGQLLSYLSVHTDNMRYDSMRVLGRQEWGVFSNKDPLKVWVDWAPPVYDFVGGTTTIKYVLRIGTEAE